jgi:hypothetical protein
MQRLDRTAIGALRLMLDRQPTTDAKVAFAWSIAAGPALARAAAVSFTAEGTLRVRPRSEAWRAEMSRARPLIAERIAALLGPGVVRRIVIDDPPAPAHDGRTRV